jgi:hypothetical protein
LAFISVYGWKKGNMKGMECEEKNVGGESNFGLRKKSREKFRRKKACEFGKIL